MRLQIWRKTLNRDRVGLIFLFFMPALWQVQIVKPTLFSIFCGMAVMLIPLVKYTTADTFVQMFVGMTSGPVFV